MIQKLERDLLAHVDKSGRDHKHVMHELENKANKDDLASLEARLLSEINQLIENLKQQFPDKDSLRKRLKAIDKDLKNLYEQIIRNKDERGVEDNAMLSKKYVGPVNCASCDKNIENLNGSPVDYNAWKKLPFREPSERIARYGQGFSKILTMMRPGADSHQPTLIRNDSVDEMRRYNNTLQDQSHYNSARKV